MERGQSHDEIPSYCGWSIFTALCCCLPLGIVALIYSHKVISTADASSTAKTLNIMGLVCGIILLILLVFCVKVFS
uniref:Uncharacterized protein n=1 Tax=Salarias fasciatus TaxID=181472 RepID=A0A672HE68_SALFA